jgi:hypothetical protein
VTTDANAVPLDADQPEPAVCGDVSWCGLPAGHEPVVDHRGHDITHAVTADGVYDIPAADYHADPTVSGSLSSTGAKLLAGPGAAPAKFKQYRDHGRPDTEAFDVGRAAHREVLGAGGGYAVIPPELCAKDGGWSTAAAKAAVAKARAVGLTPIKPKTRQLIQDMAAALREHEDAHALLSAPGRHEPAVFWTDRETGVMCRTMLDTLPDKPDGDGLLIAADYKTAASAHPDDIRKSMWNYGMHRQASWILDALEGLGLCEPGRGRVAFISQEKEPPYLVTVWFPDPVALQLADFRNRQARHAYAECTRTGVWPGYSSKPLRLALPVWAERDEMTELGS